MRTFLWLTGVTLVAAAIAVAALTEYVDRHPSSALGRGLARMALVWGGVEAAQAAQAAQPDTTPQDDGETCADPANLPIVELGFEQDDTLLRDLKIICDLAQEPEEVPVAPKQADDDSSKFASEQTDEFTPKKMPPAEEDEPVVQPVVGKLPADFTSDLDIPINAKSFKVEDDSCGCCNVLSGMFNYLACWLKGFFGAEVEVEVDFDVCPNCPQAVPCPPATFPLQRELAAQLAACCPGYPPCGDEQRVYDVLMLMCCPRGLPFPLERVGIDFEGNAPFVTHVFQAPCPPPMVWVPVHTMQPHGQFQVTGFVLTPPPVTFQHAILCPQPCCPPVMQAQFVPAPPTQEWPKGVPVPVQPIPVPSGVGGSVGWDLHYPQRVITIAPVPPLAPVPSPVRPACCLESKTAAALRKVVSIDFDEQPLSEVLEEFREMTGVNIVEDKPAVEDDGVNMDQPVTMKLKDVPAGVALKRVLHNCRLVFKIEDDIVVVTTPTVGKSQRLMMQIHPAGNAVQCADDAEVLVRLIQRVIAPDTWDVNGGPGHVDWRPHQNALVVSQTPERQQEVARLVQGLSEVLAEVENASCPAPVPPLCLPCPVPFGGETRRLTPPGSPVILPCPVPAPPLTVNPCAVPPAPCPKVDCCENDCCDKDVTCAPRMQVATADGSIIEIQLKVTKPKNASVKQAGFDVDRAEEPLPPLPPVEHPKDLPPAELPDDLPNDNDDEVRFDRQVRENWDRLWHVAGSVPAAEPATPERLPTLDDPEDPVFGRNYPIHEGGCPLNGGNHRYFGCFYYGAPQSFGDVSDEDLVTKKKAPALPWFVPLWVPF
jgi:hypothetical protein